MWVEARVLLGIRRARGALSSDRCCAVPPIRTPCTMNLSCTLQAVATCWGTVGLGFPTDNEHSSSLVIVLCVLVTASSQRQPPQSWSPWLMVRCPRQTR